MRPLLIVIACALAAAPAYDLFFARAPAPQAAVSAVQKPKKSVTNQEPKIDPCSPKGEFLGWRNCLKLGPPARMRGIWYSAFAEDFFVEGATIAPAQLDRDPPELATALEIDRKSALRRTGQRRGAWCIRAFAVEFTGRRPTEDMTAYDLRPQKLVLVDHLSSVKFLHDVMLRGVRAAEQDCIRTPNPMAPVRQMLDNY